MAQTRRAGGFSLHYFIEVEPRKNSECFTRPYLCLQPLAEALADILDITNGYRDGCPNDFEVLP